MDTPDLRLPPDVTPDEAAAITVAVERWLAAEARPMADDGSVDPWTDRRFAFAGRLEKLGVEPERVPRGVPPDPWAAMGRVRRG